MSLRATWLILLGMVAGAGLVQGARSVRHHMNASRQHVTTVGHSHAQSVDLSTAPEADLLLAGVFLTARRSGLRAAMDTLTALASRDSLVAKLGQAKLHQVAHSLGRAAASARPEGVNAFKDCRPGFLSGCPHGVMEGYFSTKPPTDTRSLGALCERISPAEPAIWAMECAHGMGHGLFQVSHGDVKSALEKCASLTQPMIERECTDGVFMSAVQRDIGRLTSRQQVTARCTGLVEKHSVSCWSYEAAYLLTKHSNDAVRAMRDCPSTPNAESAACYWGFGKQIAGSKPTDYKSVARECANAGPHVEDCIDGAVAFYTDETWTAQSAEKFCAQFSGAQASHCARAVAQEMSVKAE